MEINSDGSVISGFLVRGRVEREDGTKNGVSFAESVLQFNLEASLGGSGNGLDGEVLVDVSGHMRITVNQTKGSVLSLSGIPVGLSESLQSSEVLRKSLDAIFGVGLMLIVAVLDMPFSVLLVI